MSAKLLALPLARAIDVRILESDEGRGRPPRGRGGVDRGESAMEPIVAVPLPSEQIDAAVFLRNVLPHCEIEHLENPTILALGQHRLDSLPVSLFFQSLALCFAKHHPFGLRPEVIGYLINHEVAATVKMHPEAYRSLYSRLPEGTETIQVHDDSLALGRASNWRAAVAQFEKALRKRVPDGIMDAMLPAYSSETDVSRVASLIAFMDAASPYYGYEVQTLCGIPRVGLFGTPSDWKTLLSSTAKLAEQFEKHLGGYFRSILPILQKIAQQADPAHPVDNDFWVSIFKHESRSGGARVDGWATRFVHYASLRDEPIARVEDGPRNLGVPESELPSHLSTVEFEWQHVGNTLPMKLGAGVLALDDVDGFVTPGLSFAVMHAESSEAAANDRQERESVMARRARQRRVARARPLIEGSICRTAASAEPLIDGYTQRLTAFLRAAEEEEAGPRKDYLYHCSHCRASTKAGEFVLGNWWARWLDLHEVAYHREGISELSLSALADLDLEPVAPTRKELGAYPSLEDERVSAAVGKWEAFAATRAYLDEVLAVAARQPDVQRRPRAERAITAERDRLIAEELEYREEQAFGGEWALNEDFALLAELTHAAIPTAGFLPDIAKEILARTTNHEARRDELRRKLLGGG